MHTIWAEQALLPHGWSRQVRVQIESGRICAVQTDTAPEPQDDRVQVLLAAPANLHSHAFQRAMAGLTERAPSAEVMQGGRSDFWSWRALMYRFLERLTPDQLEAIAAYAFMQMLESGYAAVAEFHYLHHGPGGIRYQNRAEMSERILAAAQRTGIGLTLLPVLYQVGGCDGRALAGGQLRFGHADLEDFDQLLRAIAPVLPEQDTRLGIAPHSLRAVRPQDLRLCADLRPHDPVHLHLAEQQAEVEEVQAHFKQRPVERLLSESQVDQRWCLVHCTQMLPEETFALARTGATAGLCLVTEANLGDGIFDGVRWLQAGGKWGVGTDSNVAISLVDELRLFDYSQRLRDQVRMPLAASGQSSGRVLLQGAQAGGAQALGRDCGRIAVGAWADLLALDLSGVDFEGRAEDALLDAWIFACVEPVVQKVWSAGRLVVQDGRHPKRAEIEQSYRIALRGLLDAH